MKVKVKQLSENAVLPYKTHTEDFCYDCVATSCKEIAPNVYKYGIGLGFEIDRSKLRRVFQTTATDMRDTDITLSLDFRPRSSVWKTGMVLSNCQGTVDELYRGEVSAVFYHVFPTMPKYEVGDRIMQCKLGMALPMEFEWSEELSDTKRGNNGYGSTGK